MGLGEMLQGRLGARLTVILLIVTAVGTAAMAIYVTRAIETPLANDLTANLIKDARLLQEALLPSLDQHHATAMIQEAVHQYANQLGPEIRISVIAVNGTVLGDSDYDASDLDHLANQADWPEVQAALAGGIGQDLRRTRYPPVEVLYVAVPLTDSTQIQAVVRLALPLTGLHRVATAMHQLIAFGALAAFLIVLAIGVLLSRRVTMPVLEMQAIAQRIAEGDFSQRVPVAGADEIAALGRTLNRMAERQHEKIRDLEGERAKVAAILNSMVEGVMAVDWRGRVVSMNQAARWIFDMGDEWVEGRPLLEIVRHKEVLDLVAGAMQSGGHDIRRREIELGPPVERILDAHASAVTLAPSGRGIVLVLHDVTELRRLERVRAEFVANVSHELRTPLTSIRGYLETLLDGALEEPAHARRFLEIAHTHAERLSRLVDDLLQLSDLETGKLILKPTALRLREVTDEVVDFFVAQAEQKHLGLVNHVPNHIGVQADRDRLMQIFVNLVDNAVKYTSELGRIVLGAELGASGIVHVWVADTGIGIPSTDLPRLTERFYRVDKARSRELGGTGLGLAIVKHLVQAHGGDLWLTSEVGKGTTVNFSLSGTALPSASLDIDSRQDVGYTLPPPSP